MFAADITVGQQTPSAPLGQPSKALCVRPTSRAYCSQEGATRRPQHPLKSTASRDLRFERISCFQSTVLWQILDESI